jgi:hypothetical protein
MEKDYPTIRMAVVMLAGTHVSPEIVYKYTKAIAEAEARVKALGGVMTTGFSAAKIALNAPNLPYHPGALRYYKEKGLVK